MRAKRGVELGVNTMIIVVIALLVLVIVGYLIIKSAGTTTKETDCTNRGGSCSSSPTCADKPGTVPSPFGGCKDGNSKYCCVATGS